MSISKAYFLILSLAYLIQVLKEILKFITVRKGFTPLSFFTIELKIS